MSTRTLTPQSIAARVAATPRPADLDPRAVAILDQLNRDIAKELRRQNGE